MEHGLRAFAVRRERTANGLVADVIVVEPNGDEHRVRCICREDGTEIGADGPVVPYLNDRYGDRVFCANVRQAAMGG